MSTSHITPPKGLILVIGLVSMIGPFSINAYLPSFPVIAQGLGVGLPALAQTLSIYLIAFAGATLVWGPLSDRFGRRHTLLVSLVLFIVATIGCALAESYFTLMLWRALQGAFACGGVVIGRAVVRDVYEGAMAQRAMSHVMLVFAGAPALGPVIGGWLESLFGWRSVFQFLALFGLFAVVLVFRWLPETHPLTARQSIHPRIVGASYLRVLRHGRFIALVAALSLGFGGLFLYITGSPALIYDHLGLGEGDFGLIFIPTVAGLMVGSLLSARIAHSWPALKILRLGFAVLGLAFSANLLDALWSAPAVLSVVAPLVLYAFGVALVIPVLSVQALDCFPHNRGMASAVQSFAQMSFNALVAGFLMPMTASSLVHLALAQGVLLCGSVLVLWKVRVRQP